MHIGGIYALERIAWDSNDDLLDGMEGIDRIDP